LLLSFLRAGFARRALVALGALGLAGAAGCGSRTGLRGDGAGGSGVQSCDADDDCVSLDACVVMECIDTFCQEAGPVACPELDACSVGTCSSAQGACVYEPVTEDLDGDGFLGVLPGTIAGEPGSCGDDCDDTRALAFPGGEEVCDGVDNDCDGVVDNGSDYLSATVPERGLRPIADSTFSSSATGDLVFGAGTFVAGYWAKVDQQLAYIHGIDEAGVDTFSERLVTNVNATSLGADLAFSGEVFGTVLSDSRSGDYEVYFARFDALGQKLGPDLRLTDAPGFSTHERLSFDQGRFVVVWDDHRETVYGGTPRVFAQLLDTAGEPLTANVALSESGEHAEYPIIAATPSRFAVVHTVLTEGDEAAVRLRTFDKTFGDATSEIVVPGGVRVPNVTAIGSSLLVTWTLYGTGPGAVIRGALFDERGRELVSARDLTSGANFAHSHAVLSLGDRALLVWADDADGNYELYAKVLGLDLADIEPRTRLTDDPADSLLPSVAISEMGKVGILFDDWRSSLRLSYFMTLGCQLDEPPVGEPPDGEPPDGGPCDCSLGCVPGACAQCCVK
jgi:hypothetical protein